MVCWKPTTCHVIRCQGASITTSSMCDIIHALYYCKIKHYMRCIFRSNTRFSLHCCTINAVGVECSWNVCVVFIVVLSSADTSIYVRTYICIYDITYI